MKSSVKPISLILSLLLILTAFAAFPLTAGADSEELPFVPVNSGVTGECRWSASKRVLTVKGSGAMADYGWTEGSGAEAPWADLGITETIIENGVTHIGDGAFRFDGPVNVSFPDSVTSIGSGAFSGCESLKSVTIPASVTQIADDAFDGCSEELVICGEAGSAAQAYAARKSISFVSLTPLILGDADGSGSVDAADATIVQRAVSKLAVPYPEETYMLGDVDGSGELEITDATFIQRYSTYIKTPYPIGEAKE